MNEDDADDLPEESTQVVRAPVSPAATASSSRRPYLVLAGQDGKGADYWPLDSTKVIGREATVDIRLEFEGVSRQHVRIVVDGERLVAQDLNSRNGVFVNGVRVEAVRLSEGDALQLGGATLRVVFRDAVDEAAFKALQESTRRDALTGAYNRRYLDERLEAEFAYARRHRSVISVLLIDVDHFKRVNDTFGHLAGDAVLRELTVLINRQLRVEDVLARYGGEELLVLCRDIDVTGVRVLAERIRATVEAARMTFQGQAIAITISGGVTAGPRPSDATASALLQRADEALYAAKRAGRNQIVTA